MTEQKFHVGVKALILNDKNEILILKKESNDERPEHWDLPGGRIKEGDSAEMTLRKEIVEEIGIRDDEIDIKRQFHAGSSKPEIYSDKEIRLVLIVYLCDIHNNKFVLSNEHSEFRWASINEAKILLSIKFNKEFIEKLDALREFTGMKERPKIGIGVIIFRDGKALFLKRKSPYGKDTWCYPGGHLEFGETIFDAGIREVEEETGLKANNPIFLCITNDIFEDKHYSG